MAQFHDGQEVEVFDVNGFHISDIPHGMWRKAKFIYKTKFLHEDVAAYNVEFRDGTRSLFSVDDIRDSERA
jgi:hypothetical protein